MSDRPLIGITMGDPAGIGPELCLRLLSDPALREPCRLRVFGSLGLLRRVAGVCGLPEPRVADVVDDPLLDPGAVSPGVVQAACGAAAARAIETAVQSALRGETAALVTAPINKASLHAANVPFPGHTEMLAEWTGSREICMMMASVKINVCLVTTHLALQAVPACITTARVRAVIRLAEQAMRGRGIPHPRVTVCGLNPHAGEGGLFGQEEQSQILPAVEQARMDGVMVRGPLPPDTAFLPTLREETDVYVVMYHDQGLIPFKMLAFETGVNVTLGLPLIRTSPDHGTAFDLAWQGKAKTGSMHAALRLALCMTRG